MSCSSTRARTTNPPSAAMVSTGWPTVIASPGWSWRRLSWASLATLCTTPAKGAVIAQPAHLRQRVLPVLVALRRVGLRGLNVAALVLRGVGAGGGQGGLRLRDRVAVGAHAVGEHRRLARDLGVRLAAVADRLLVGHPGLVELGDGLVERVARDRLLPVEVAVGVGDALRLAQVGLAAGDVGVGRRALLGRRGTAVAQPGLRPGALVGDGLVERRARRLQRGLGLHDRGAVLGRQRAVGGSGRAGAPAGGQIGLPRVALGVDQLRVGDGGNQLPAGDVVARLDPDPLQVAGDERGQHVGLRALHHAGLGQLRLVAGVGHAHHARAHRGAARARGDDAHPDDGDQRQQRDDEVAPAPAAAGGGRGGGDDGAAAHGAPGSTTASGSAAPTATRRRTSASR